MKHDERLANDIRNALQAKMCRVEWKQFHSSSAYTGTLQNVTIGNKNFYIIPFRSYDTIVAYIDYETHILYEVGKYSRTTSKHVTQYYNHEIHASERVYYNRIYS